MKKILSLLLLPFLLFSQDLLVETGTYTGNGTSQNITGVGFTPKFVMVKGNTAQNGTWRTTAHTATQSSSVSNVAVYTTAITALGADGFSVGSSAVANSNTVTYYWVAFGGDNVASGKEVGTGAEKVVTVPFTPDLVFAQAMGIGAAADRHTYWRGSQQTGNNADPLVTSQQGNNGINAIGTNSFTAGVLTAQASDSFYWCAIDAGANALEMGSYTGDGNDNRDIAMSNSWTPDFLLVDATTVAATAVWRITEVTGDAGLRFDNAVNLANTIQSMGAGTFQVGSNAVVNTNLATILYVAIRNYVTPTATTTPATSLIKNSLYSRYKRY